MFGIVKLKKKAHEKIFILWGFLKSVPVERTLPQIPVCKGVGFCLESPCHVGGSNTQG